MKWKKGIHPSDPSNLPTTRQVESDWIISQRDRLLLLMKRTSLAVLGFILLISSGCSGRLSTRTVRQQIAALGESNLVPSDVAVERIVTELGGRLVAETTVKMAFQFERDADGEWRIVAARLGDRQWVDIDLLFEALETLRAEESTVAMQKLATGLGQYRTQNGRFPEIEGNGYLSDLLHPGFMSELIREDAWGVEIRYELRDSSYRLRSSGPDRIVGNGDDVLLDGPL